jgi:hypothetical protein
VASLMTLLVRLECPLDRMNESGFDAESHGLRREARASQLLETTTQPPQTTSDSADSTEGDNKT